MHQHFRSRNAMHRGLCAHAMFMSFMNVYSSCTHAPPDLHIPHARIVFALYFAAFVLTSCNIFKYNWHIPKCDAPCGARRLSRTSCFFSSDRGHGDLIVFEDVSVSFGSLEVLKGISLEIATGSKTVIIGPSGSGKSTLLRTINMFERPVRGNVYIDGVAISSMTNRMLCQARQDIGMVFQNFNLYPHKTVLENLTMAPIVLKHEKKDAVTERAMSNLREVNIAEKADAYPSQLSGGQQQRVAIARALTMRPKIMLFDEPTSALDPEMIQEVLDIMERVARETPITMLFVTHEMKFAEHIADRVLFLDDGNIREDGTPDKVFHHPKNERTTAFLGKILH